MSGDRIDTPIGRHWVSTSNPRDESELRDGLASLAWLCGWNVKTEVPVSTGARIDLLLTAPDGRTIVVETKMDLTTRRKLRLGFQQLEGYRLETGADSAILVAPKINAELAREFGKVYWAIACIQTVRLEELIRSGWADGWNAAQRHEVARRRTDSILEMAGYATATLKRSAEGQVVA